MKCLIIAAGRGWRLRTRTDSKPLYPVLGVPLIERVMRSAADGGATGFVVVTGYNGPAVRAHLDAFAERSGLPVAHVVNEQWELSNGLSVLKAQEVLPEPFLLSMSDHLFDPRTVAALLAAPPAPGETVLAVDYDLANPLVDLDDVTRVAVTDGRIGRVGKGLDAYDAYDTGLFYATPALFDAIEQAIATTGDASLSGGMNVLAAAGRARAFDVEGRFWMDVDGPAEADLAERVLRERLGVHP